MVTPTGGETNWNTCAAVAYWDFYLYLIFFITKIFNKNRFLKYYLRSTRKIVIAVDKLRINSLKHFNDIQNNTKRKTYCENQYKYKHFKLYDI